MIHLLGVAHREQASLDLQGTPQTDAQKHYADVRSLLKNIVPSPRRKIIGDPLQNRSQMLVE
jgi:hypothetical protein